MALSSRKVLVAVLVLVVCVFAVVRARHDRAYELNVLMPSADGAIKGSAVTIDGQPVGEVTSGNFSPVLGHGIALAFLPPDGEEGTSVSVDVRGTALAGRVVATPFVSSPKG